MVSGKSGGDGGHADFLITAYCWKKKMLKAWMPIGMVASFLGFVGILAAPGNYVRYGEQGSGKGILIHIGNQFAGNGEMILIYCRYSCCFIWYGRH